VGSLPLEVFFKKLEEALFARVNKYYKDKAAKDEKEKRTSTSSKINNLLTILGKSSKVTVLTDKTNSFRIIKLGQYIEWVEKHLNDSSTESLRERLVKIHEKVSELLAKVGDSLNDKEYDYIKESLNSRAIPTPKLLIKDHKKPNKRVTIQLD